MKVRSCGCHNAYRETIEIIVLCNQAKPFFLNPHILEDDEEPSCPSYPPPHSPALARLLPFPEGTFHTSPSRILSGRRAHKLGGWHRCGPGADGDVRKRKRKTRFFIFRSFFIFVEATMVPASEITELLWECWVCIRSPGAVDRASAWASRAQGSQKFSGALKSVVVNTLCEVSMAGRGRHLQQGVSCKPSRRKDNCSGSQKISTERRDLTYFLEVFVFLPYFEADFLKVAPT